jgi:uncharacterized protein (DUF433 family)
MQPGFRETAREEPISLLGIGLYTVPEAARLTRVAPGRIRRWRRGYSFRRGGEARHSAALWEPQVPEIDGATVLGFLDLMEIRFVDRFGSAGVSPQTVRQAVARARELIGRDHPFATRRFRTDGRGIFAQIARDEGEDNLLDLVKNQYAFNRVISPSLYDDLDFSPSDEALWWWPLGRKRGVAVDPARSFGQPIIAKTGIATGVMAAAVEAEGSIEAAARWYAVEPALVKAALDFEKSLAA